MSTYDYTRRNMVIYRLKTNTSVAYEFIGITNFNEFTYEFIGYCSIFNTL